MKLVLNHVNELLETAKDTQQDGISGLDQMYERKKNTKVDPFFQSARKTISSPFLSQIKKIGKVRKNRFVKRPTVYTRLRGSRAVNKVEDYFASDPSVPKQSSKVFSLADAFASGPQFFFLEKMVIHGWHNDVSYPLSKREQSYFCLRRGILQKRFLKDIDLNPLLFACWLVNEIAKESKQSQMTLRKNEKKASSFFLNAIRIISHKLTLQLNGRNPWSIKQQCMNFVFEIPLSSFNEKTSSVKTDWVRNASSGSTKVCLTALRSTDDYVQLSDVGALASVWKNDRIQEPTRNYLNFFQMVVVFNFVLLLPLHVGNKLLAFFHFISGITVWIPYAHSPLRTN